MEKWKNLIVNIIKLHRWFLRLTQSAVICDIFIHSVPSPASSPAHRADCRIRLPCLKK